MDTDSLYLYYFDEENQQWLPVPGQFDRDNLILTATLDHFSYYGEQANPLQNGPGRVMASQVDLHTGASTFNYPIELPPGPGGFQPSLSLTYNSGSVDGMKNKRDMGSWVGIGWSLHLGRISYNLSTDEYFLEINGASYELIPVNSTHYRTNPDQYFKIIRSGNTTWEIWDREGNYYRFGNTTDSIQYVYDTSKKYYRWDLSLINDTNGNSVSVNYTQEKIGSSPNDTVRSAYLDTIVYGNIQVIFTLGYDEDAGTDGYLRYDNPKSYGYNPAPKIMETRRLNCIEIKVSGSLLRRYTFAYTTTNRVFSYDYGGIYYSGKHKLNSITQFGADGASSLPAITFSYQDKQVYRKTNEDEYTGNPGNPASLTWPFLTTINSGYGGSISLTYTQIPDTSVLDIWTRQAVTTKIVNGGMGVTETYTYAYTDYPQYLGFSWDQQFRGWNEVKETDTASNYIKHWFYTTGTIDGKDAERLTGREYKTEWYDSSDNPLKTKTYEWSWEDTAGKIYPRVCMKVWVAPGKIATANGFVYVGGDQYIKKYTAEGVFITQWDTSYQNLGIAASSDNYVYILVHQCYAGYCLSGIRKYTTSGSFVKGWSTYGTCFGIDVSTDGYVYVSDMYNYKISKYTTNGTQVGNWSVTNPRDVAVSPDGNYVYVLYDTNGRKIAKYTSSGSLVTQWQGNNNNTGISISPDGSFIYVSNDSNDKKVKIYTNNGTFLKEFSTIHGSHDIAVSEDNLIYISAGQVEKYYGIRNNWSIRLDQVDETTEPKTSRIRYEYDDYGNVVTEYLDGDTGTNLDNTTIHREFYVNNSANILNKPAREYITDYQDNIMKETRYYYDGNNTSYSTPPTKGNLTRVEQKKDASNSVSGYFTYDTYGNILTSQDPNGQKVYIPGLGDVESITMESYIWLMHMTPEARGEVIAVVEAYSNFRWEYPDQAAKLEGLNETVNIEFGETNHPHLESIMQENNGEYTITIKQNLIYADDFYQAGAILSASYDITLSEFVVPRGVYVAGGIILFIAGTMLTAGGGAALMVALFTIEPIAATTAACYASSFLVIGGLTVDLSLNMLTEGEVDLPTEAIPPY